MPQKILDLINTLNSDTKEITELSKIFFSSVPIQPKKHLISSGTSIPSPSGGYINNEPNDYTFYTWGKLSTELLEMQSQIHEKYALWYENSRFLIKKIFF